MSGRSGWSSSSHDKVPALEQKGSPASWVPCWPTVGQRVFKRGAINQCTASFCTQNDTASTPRTSRISWARGEPTHHLGLLGPMVQLNKKQLHAFAFSATSFFYYSLQVRKMCMLRHETSSGLTGATVSDSLTVVNKPSMFLCSQFLSSGGKKVFTWLLEGFDQMIPQPENMKNAQISAEEAVKVVCFWESENPEQDTVLIHWWGELKNTYIGPS